MSYFFSRTATIFPSLSTFFFNDTTTTEIYTLSLHDALPISRDARLGERDRALPRIAPDLHVGARTNRERAGDRKSTRLNSSHSSISYAVFCLKKKNCCISANFTALPVPSSSSAISYLS